MNKKDIKKIFAKHGIVGIDFIEKIEIGFTNEIYSIDDKFILKVCEDIKNEKNFEQEVFLYEFFKNKLPVPKVIIFDKSKEIYNKDFMIYTKIKGDTLYSQWHLMDDIKRKNIVKQLANFLKIINNSNYLEFVNKFNIDSKIDWKELIISKINNSLKEIKKQNLLNEDLIAAIEKYINKYQDVLKEQKIKLVYWDMHFDNILIEKEKVVGFLDFERTELASIDFALDIFCRMIEQPKKYMSKETEKFAKKKDYENLLIWFKEFYPELFDFENLDKRLNLYSIEHDLKDVIGWPSASEPKEQIAKIVGYKI